MTLSAEQLQAIDTGEALPLVVQGRKCVLLSSAAYDQMREAVDDWEPSTMRRQLAVVMVEDWNDPTMSVYDE